jgi:hypothetical protein
MEVIKHNFGSSQQVDATALHEAIRQRAEQIYVRNGRIPAAMWRTGLRPKQKSGAKLRTRHAGPRLWSRSMVSGTSVNTVSNRATDINPVSLAPARRFLSGSKEKRCS